ncbi:MAG: hypothetical protein WCK37_02070 [Candidatus Falkowbacteria bacterium]
MNANISLTPIAGWQKLSNKSPNKHCCICGHSFNDKGYCKQGHYQGQSYYKKPADKNAAGKTY